MKICMKQMMVYKENIYNLEQLNHIEDCDILVLPEMWNCPYYNDVLKESYTWHDESLNKLIQVAKKHHIWIVGGSICAKENNHLYNRCYIIDDTGEIVCHYDKTHLFTFKNYTESDVFTAGDHFQTFDTPWGKCGILLCYDIRFPEVTRILSKQGAQILFCPAAFNESATRDHWSLLTKTRALENEVFVCGVALAKYTYKNYTSGGHSIMIDPFGKVMKELNTSQEECVVDIDLNKVDEARKRMPFWKIRRVDLYADNKD